jgi:hypothetical protein
VAKGEVVIRKLWLVVALAVAGCGTGGAWSKDGFSQETYKWKASYPPGQTALLGADWRVDNWDRRTENSPGGNPTTSFSEKTGPGFTVDFEEDGNGDGKIDEHEKGRQYLYDLKLAHVPDDGVIWIKTRTLSEGDVRKSLELLTERYLHSERLTTSLLGLGYEMTAVTNRAETRLGPHRALAVSLEAKLNSVDRGELRRIDLLVTKYEYELPAVASSTSQGSETGSKPKPPAARFATAFMVIGYVNTASRFSAARGDLDQLVARLSWQPGQNGAGRILPPAADEEGDSRWTATGFEQRRYGWKAGYAEGTGHFVSADWRLREGTGESGYTGRADLRFENLHNNGFIWTDTATLSIDEATKDLDVLFENYVGHLAQVGFGGRAVIGSREEIKLGPYSAVSATLEREPTAPEREGRVKTIATKIRLVVTKFEYLERPKRAGVTGERCVAFMVVGYANDSVRFDGGLEDFARFLGRTTWPSQPAGGNPVQPAIKAPSPPAKPLDPNQPKIET